MKRHLLIIAGIAACISMANAQLSDIFKYKNDIGKPWNLGSYVYNPREQSYLLRGAGYNIWFERDEFHYMYNRIKGDFMITANFRFEGKGVNKHRKTGLMLRADENDNSSHISAVLHGDGLTVMQWRDFKGAPMKDPDDEIFADSSSYNVLQIERSSKVIFMRAAHNDGPMEEIGSYEMPEMPEEVFAGTFICSHDPDVIEEATIWNIRIDKPVADNYDPGKEGYLGSRLETMDVFTGKRLVIYEKQGRIEAPNWMPDGNKLLFNMDGSIYTIPTTGGTIEKLNTDFANRNNNDHGISFNGKLLAISNHRDGLPGGGSTVYVLPLKGGKPKMVTEDTPSYWHGWSPDSKEVLYVAQRNNKPVYNIYRNSINGGREVALTDLQEGEHADGCEYSPDGNYIWYNGNYNGKMHIWRMKPDGTGKEEMTNDKYNDWFPHVSPDGKWVVFLSFPEYVEPNSHPFYKRVMLRLMPAGGGEPKVIAYLYGGQGTMNVPSWAPDSRHIAFVSNSGK
jgi:TolB protein